MKRTSHRRSAFTLLEVLLALTIFVGSVAVLSQLVGLGVDQADLSRIEAEGLLLVENRFAELDAQLIEPELYSGESDEFFPGWTWGLTPEDLGNYLYQVTISATHQNGHTVTLSRLYFDAEAAEEALAEQQSSSSSSTGSSTSSAAGGS
jgi:prepilin-type N-terminal cleavage/methylation domain-containing protein